MIVDLRPITGNHSRSFQGTIDLTDFGEVVGLEILDFQRQLQTSTPVEIKKEGLPRWSYDDEIDAFYLRLSAEPASAQEPVVGIADVDDMSRLTRLNIIRRT